MTSLKMPFQRFALCVPLLFSCILIATPRAHAGIVFESATLGTTGIVGGLFIDNEFIAGTWFTLTETTQITSIGGHVSTNSPGVWTSIVALAPGTLPDASFDIETNSLVSGLLTNFGKSADLRVNVDATLTPGDYAILIGGTLSGTPSSGAMPGVNFDLPGSSYFGRTSQGWDDVVNRNNQRFVVEGFTAVPEPSSLLYLTAGVFFAIVLRRRKANASPLVR